MTCGGNPPGPAGRVNEVAEVILRTMLFRGSAPLGGETNCAVALPMNVEVPVLPPIGGVVPSCQTSIWICAPVNVAIVFPVIVKLPKLIGSTPPPGNKVALEDKGMLLATRTSPTLAPMPVKVLLGPIVEFGPEAVNVTTV